MKRVHFIGIGGSGTSAIAALAQANGYQVTGCDKNPHTEFTKNFNPAQLFEGHTPDHLKGVDILAITPAISSLDPNNDELQEAKRLGLEVVTWQEFMGKYLEEGKFVIAVCGTHGKSTTTAMIGILLEDAGLDPTVELGAIVPKWGTNYRIGKSNYFVTEADEFNDNFLATTPDIAVVNAIEFDHPEFFKDLEDYKESYEEFLNKTKGTVVANMSDANVGDVMKYVVKNTGVTVLDFTKSDFNLSLKVPGKHNIRNASAAFQVGLLLGIDPTIIRESLENFAGIGRRLELVGQFKEAKVYTSFGHHPSEIKTDLEALHDQFPDKKIIMVFQPHMFSRTKALFNNFVSTLKDLPTTQIFIVDIYPSREVDTGLVHSKQLVEAIHADSVMYIPTPHEANQKLQNELSSNNIVIFMGAGDIDKYAREIIKL